MRAAAPIRPQLEVAPARKGVLRRPVRTLVFACLSTSACPAVFPLRPQKRRAPPILSVRLTTLFHFPVPWLLVVAMSVSVCPCLGSAGKGEKRKHAHQRARQHAWERLSEKGGERRSRACLPLCRCPFCTSAHQSCHIGCCRCCGDCRCPQPLPPPAMQWGCSTTRNPSLPLPSSRPCSSTLAPPALPPRLLSAHPTPLAEREMHGWHSAVNRLLAW